MARNRNAIEQLERDTLASELRALRHITGLRGVTVALLTEDESDGLLALHNRATQEYRQAEVIQTDHGRTVRFVEMSPDEKADFAAIQEEAAHEMEAALKRVRARLSV